MAPKPAADDLAASTAALPWFDTLADGYTESQRHGRPVLVRAGAAWCPWCRVLERELEQPAVRRELTRWTRVALDVDTAPSEARRLAIGSIPALRVLTPAGKLVASRDGAASSAELAAWLREHYTTANAAAPAELVETGTPDAAAIGRLIEQFAERDATLREAAVRRLLPHPQQAAPPVVETLSRGRLAARLTALELLRDWEAPADGLDPWQPETLTADRLETLTQWAAALGESPPAEKSELAPDELAAARSAIDKLLAAEPAEARAIRERLARFGRLLLPEVYERLKLAETDAARERLIELRYRLVAADELVLEWPGGLERLSATDLDTRLRAAEELAARATAADEPLLLELFSDPAPLVREISLGALARLGGTVASGSLVRLLDDPEPNVRAAVLKQMTENPRPNLVPRIADYVARERDADLIVHAVRLLRAIKSAAAHAALRPLLKHESWRVRAEAAEGLGESFDQVHLLGGGNNSDDEKALIEVLTDSDGFVVSRAVAGLRATTLPEAVDPLARVTAAHPELATQVVEVLAGGNLPEDNVTDHLRRLAVHTNASVRAAAITGLGRLLAGKAREDFARALGDPSAEVRIAAADAFFEHLNAVRRGETASQLDPTHMVEVDEAAEAGFLQGFLRLLIPERTGAIAVPAGKEASQPAQPESDEPVEAPLPDSGAVAETDAEKWLRQVRAGQGFEAWEYEMADRLAPMLASDAPEERLAAALPLAALGRDSLAIPVLSETLQSAPNSVARIARALPWLLWDDRKALFDQLVAAAATADELEIVAQLLAEVADRRAAASLWDLLDRPDTGASMAETLRTALERIYFGESWWDESEVAKRQIKLAPDEAARRSRAESRWQRLTALSLLLRLDRAAAAEIAQELYDSATDDTQRLDAFQMLLLAGTKTPATEHAVAGLSHPSPQIRGRALEYLALGAAPLRSAESGEFWLSDGSGEATTLAAASGQPILPEAPPGLTAEPLLPFLRATDARDAALAGYLLVLLDEPQGLEPLIDYWRTHARQEETWRRLVYRAVAYLDDSRHTALLDEIYQDLSREEYADFADFYWTIRIMTGAEALALRKRIRDEVGMDRLR
ncbi:MAG: thioredoxin family protein [Planctomycetes bacterium]|nr:thioredoxin family protein [Planctomycetota bacterium]